MTVKGEATGEYLFVPAVEKPQGLLIVLPGGDGSADFHPFVKSIQHGALKGKFAVAQPLAKKWRSNQQIVWPTLRNRTPGMKYATEELVAAGGWISKKQAYDFTFDVVQRSRCQGAVFAAYLQFELRHLGPIETAMRSCKTVKESLEVSARLGSAAYEGNEYFLRIDGDTAWVAGRASLKRLDFGIGKASDPEGAWVSLEIALEITLVTRRKL